MKMVATIRARMGSTRLADKVLKPAAGKPLLQHLIERLQQAQKLDGIVVATSTSVRDDAIVELSDALGVSCFRGSEDDVLDRILGAVEASGAEASVEIMGDNPLIDTRIVDWGVEIWENGEYDMVTNQLKTTYPPGMEIRIHSTAALVSAAELAIDPADREHGSYFNPASRNIQSNQF
jgi:spore coat polysaccharide biosynthesis protein SpsF